MPQDIKLFRLGGQNLDDALEFIAQEDWRTAFNMRVTGTSDGEAGNATNIESTSLIAGDRPTGINQGIGAAGFEIVRTAYFFIYNSQQMHIIGKLDYDTKVQTILFQNISDSGNEDILTLDPAYYISDVKLIDDIYLTWVTNSMQPCLINLERLESGGYGTLTLYDLLIIKAQVLIPPTAVYGDDAGQSVNLLQGKLFQFRTQLEYQDNYRSAGSTWSERPVPTSEATPAVGTDVSVNNHLIVSVDIGTDRVDTVRVWGHYANLDWFVVQSATRAYILALPTAIDIATEVYEAYDPATNLYSFAFYNDGLYEDVDVAESDLDYDHVPLTAESEEIVNGNIIDLAGITEGYERPEVTANLSVVSYNPNVGIPPPAPGTFVVFGTTIVRPRNQHWRSVSVTLRGTPQTGDIVTVVFRDIRNYSQTTTYTLTVLVSETLAQVGTRLATIIPSSSVNNTPATTVISRTADYYELASATITYFSAGSSVIRSVHALKSNSSYQLALAHFDYWGRYFPVVTGTDYIINTQSYAQSSGQSPMINWQITSDPPAEAVSAQWLISRNNTHQTTLMVDAVLDVNATTQSPGYFVFNINSLRKFNQNNNSSVLSYEFTEGDRCTFLFYYSSGTTPVYLNNPAIDVEVGGFEITALGDYILKVRKSSSLAAATITGKNLLLELYTPRLRTISEGGQNAPAPQLFYEIGNEIPIINGSYSITSGQITQGDIYFKVRQYVGAVDPNTLYNFQVEDFNYSDFYPSAFTSYGRARFYLDEPGRVELKACMRYSDEHQRRSFINGLNRFYPDSIYGDADGQTSSSFGWIRKIAQRGQELIVIQENEVASVPTFQTLVEDQSGSGQYALSLKLFNNVRYSGLGYGMGNAKESYARYYNNLYFFDPNKSCPVRTGLDGTRDISGKMSMFFKRTGQAAYALGKKLIGYYDIFYSEYLKATQTYGDIVAAPAFTPTNWQFEDPYAVPAADITTGGNSHGVATYNTGTGIATFTPTTGYTGPAGFTFSFTPSGGVPTTKNVCITVTAGTDAVLPFGFLAQTGVETSTLTISNTILVYGNDIPAAISIAGNGGQYSINGGAYTSSAGTVNENDIVSVRQLSSASYETLTTTTLTIDGQSAAFNITTKDQSPDPFTFVDITAATVNVLYVSNTVTITGITGAVAISITTGEYSINGGTFTSSPGTVTNGQTVAVRRTSSASYLTTVSTTLTVGSYSDTYSITTQDGTPDPFSFTDVTGADISSLYISNSVTITGVTGAVPISVTGGEYSINGGAFTSAAGTINSGQTVRVRVTSSSDYTTAVNGALTVGTYSDTYTVTTKAAPSVDIAWSNTQDLSPFTVGIFKYYLEGVETLVERDNTSGTISVAAGSLVKFVQDGDPVTYKWPSNDEGDGNSANMVVTNGATELYNETATIQVATLNEYEFIVLEDGDYSVDLTTASTVTGMSTYTATAISDELNVEMDLVDETSGLIELQLIDVPTSSTAYRFNVITDASTLTANFQNDSAVTVTATVNGDDVIITAGNSGAVTGIAKGNLTITVTS